jgi:hypothetical protein
MQETDFRNWLRNNKNYEPGTVNSRTTNCLRVEESEGDLDTHFQTDMCRALLNRLTYSADDEQNNRPPRHRIPIDGDIRNGTSTLKHAINLYVEYKQSNMPAGATAGRETIKTGILSVVFNKWLRDPETGRTPYKIIAAASARDGNYNLDLKIPGKLETLFAYQFEDYKKCEKAEQAIHKLLAQYKENGDWFTLDDNQLALIKLSCEGALGGTLIME